MPFLAFKNRTIKNPEKSVSSDQTMTGANAPLIK